jgi:galactose mutarotase-like enzyme
VINELGAEIISLKSNVDDSEYIWQAEPAVWAGSAPILFPIVGRLNNKKYTVNGQDFSLPTHGFINSQTFSVKEKSASSITLTTCFNQSTLKVYPFMFRFDVTFALKEKELTVSYEIKNLDSSDLYFAIGSHPAFSLPLHEFEDDKCEVIFSKEENNYCQLIKNDLLSQEKFPVELFGKSLKLSPGTFEQDALIFRDINSSLITLMVANKPMLALEIGNNKHLGLWAKPNAPYICIEPWTATDETLNTPAELKDKPDMISLPEKEAYTNFYKILIL